MIVWDQPPSNPLSDPMARDLSEMTEEELTLEGERALVAHMLDKARLFKQFHGPLNAENVYTLLRDENQLRYPVRLVYEFGEMSFHQFAQPTPDHRTPGGVILYLRPQLKELTRMLPLAVAYMVPLINYGEEMIRDEFCLQFGAEILGITPEEYYAQLCLMAEELGLQEQTLDDNFSCECGGH